MAQKTNSAIVLAMRLERYEDAKNRPFSVTLARCSQVPESLKDSMSQPNVQGDKYCRTTYKNTGDYELAKHAHNTRQVFQAVPQAWANKGGKGQGGIRATMYGESCLAFPCLLRVFPMVFHLLRRHMEARQEARQLSRPSLPSHPSHHSNQLMIHGTRLAPSKNADVFLNLTFPAVPATQLS